MNENEQTTCNKCGVWDDVANMKADGYGRFLCIECAYDRLESINTELKRTIVKLVDEIEKLPMPDRTILKRWIIEAKENALKPKEAQ